MLKGLIKSKKSKNLSGTYKTVDSNKSSVKNPFKNLDELCNYINDYNNFIKSDSLEKLKNQIIDLAMKGEYADFGIEKSKNRENVIAALNQQVDGKFTKLDCFIENDKSIATNTAKFIANHAETIATLLVSEGANYDLSKALAPALARIQHADKLALKALNIDKILNQLALAELLTFESAHKNAHVGREIWLEKIKDFSLKQEYTDWNKELKDFIKTHDEIKEKTDKNKAIDKKNDNLSKSIKKCTDFIKTNSEKSYIFNFDNPWNEGLKDFAYTINQGTYISALKTIAQNIDLVEKSTNKKTGETIYTLLNGFYEIKPYSLFQLLIANKNSKFVIAGISNASNKTIEEATTYEDVVKNVLFITEEQKHLLATEYTRLIANKENIDNKFSNLKKETAKKFQDAQFAAKVDLYNLVLEQAQSKNNTSLAHELFNVDHILTKHMIENMQDVKLAMEIKAYENTAKILNSQLSENTESTTENAYNIEPLQLEYNQALENLKTLQANLDKTKTRVMFGLVDSNNLVNDRYGIYEIISDLTNPINKITQWDIEENPEEAKSYEIDMNLFDNKLKEYKDSVSTQQKKFVDVANDIKKNDYTSLTSEYLDELSKNINNTGYKINNYYSGHKKALETLVKTYNTIISKEANDQHDN